MPSNKMSTEAEKMHSRSKMIVQARIHQIIYSLAKDGYKLMYTYLPINDFNCVKLLNLKNGNIIRIYSESNTIEIWKNGKLRKTETVSV